MHPGKPAPHVPATTYPTTAPPSPSPRASPVPPRTSPQGWTPFSLLFSFFFFFSFLLFRAIPVAYGGSGWGSNWSHICDLHHSSGQRQIPNPLSGARDRPRVLMDTPQVLNQLSHSSNSWTPFSNDQPFGRQLSQGTDIRRCTAGKQHKDSRGKGREKIQGGDF